MPIKAHRSTQTISRVNHPAFFTPSSNGDGHSTGRAADDLDVQ
jgi:hypothetical protein